MTHTSEPLTVCHLTYSFLPLVGGMEEFIHNLCLAQKQGGSLEPVVLAPRVRRRTNALDVPYRVCRYSRPSSKRYGLSQVILPMLFRHWRYRFDLIHAHGVYPSGHLARLFTRLTGVPVVVTPEGGDLEGDDTGCIISPAVHRRIRRCFAEADRVTAISSDMRRRILALGAREERLVSIPHGVWTRDFRPADTYAVRTAQTPYIAYIGSMIRRKGVDVLLEAFARIHPDFPQVRLRLAGTGPLLDDLKARAEALGISDAVDFVGVLRDRPKVEFLQQALFMVCPSRGEPFGIVNVEGLAAGVPVIATRVGGIPDIILNGETGYLIELDNPADLAGRMSELLASEEKRMKMAARALTRAGEFDWETITARYEALYRELV